MLKEKRVRFWLTLYIFIAVFQPPVLPVSTIYIFGILTIGLILWKGNGRINTYILKACNLKVFMQVIGLMAIYLIIISSINGLYNPADLFINRLRCVNQLVVLTLIQLASIYFIALISIKYNLELKDIINILIKVGIVQGVCAILAYVIPQVRILFLRYASDMYFESYMWERRGYGFSSMLIDVFGYGMGLLAGYALLCDKYIMRFSRRLLGIMLMLFSIMFNARTGLIVFLIAVALKFLKKNNKAIVVCRAVLLIVLSIGMYFWVVPVLIQKGISSSNITIRWIASAFSQIYNAIGSSLGEKDISFSFISDKVALSDNVFEFVFGSGHSVYGTSSILGFATDIGYTNLFWIYGGLGTCIILFVFVKLFFSTYKYSESVDIKYMAILNATVYFLVLFKGNLLGYNPGTYITYYFTFLIPLFYHIKNRNGQSKDIIKIIHDV